MRGQDEAERFAYFYWGRKIFWILLWPIKINQNKKLLLDAQSEGSTDPLRTTYSSSVGGNLKQTSRIEEN
ncbi:hypothetical protein LCGC14_1583980 [marine sediment metagenome]|uniref:Uncharacterized protein n=1 Tax=marine sediment metagenome TaxID=412755 RepID=A0A0F9LGD4_9ZZZZ